MIADFATTAYPPLKGALDDSCSPISPNSIPVFPQWKASRKECRVKVPGAAGRCLNASWPILVCRGSTCSHMTCNRCQSGTAFIVTSNCIRMLSISSSFCRKCFQKTSRKFMIADFATIAHLAPQGALSDSRFSLFSNSIPELPQSLLSQLF